MNRREISNLRTDDLERLSHGQLLEHGPGELDVLTVIKRLTTEGTFFMGHATDYSKNCEKEG
jgi:hypothetical protein